MTLQLKGLFKYLSDHWHNRCGICGHKKKVTFNDRPFCFGCALIAAHLNEMEY